MSNDNPNSVGVQFCPATDAHLMYLILISVTVLTVHSILSLCNLCCNCVTLVLLAFSASVVISDMYYTIIVFSCPRFISPHGIR